MSNQNDAIEAFKRHELKYQRQKEYEQIRKQHQMEMDNFHNPWQQGRFDRAYTQKKISDREKEIAHQLHQLQGLPEPEKEYRKMAEQVRCLRCKWKNPEGCWECSGTGISPIPFAEVMKLR